MAPRPSLCVLTCCFFFISFQTCLAAQGDELAQLSVRGRDCEPWPVPFNSSIVAKKFSIFDSCYRPRGTGFTTATRRYIEYVPLFFYPTLVVPHGSCPIYYRYFFNRRHRRDYIRKGLPTPLKNVGVTNGMSTSEILKRCRKRQKAQFSRARGRTRSLFKQAVRDMFFGVQEIKNYKCTILGPGIRRTITNPGAEYILNFFMGVAYRNSICIAG